MTLGLKDLDITERIFELEYSSGESIILLRQSLDIASAIYGIQDPGPWIHVTVYTEPYPVPHETTNTVNH